MNKVFNSLKFLLLLILISASLKAMAIEPPTSAGLNNSSRSCEIVKSDITKVNEAKAEALSQMKSRIDDFSLGKISLVTYLHELQEHEAKIKHIESKQFELIEELLSCDKSID